MRISLEQLLAVPTFDGDEDKTRQARVLNTILLAWMSGSVVMTATVPFMGLPLLNWLVVSLVFDTMVVGLWVMMRRGHIRLVSGLLSVELVIFFTFLTYAFGGVSEPSYSGYVGVVLIAGLLLGGRAALVSAAIGIVAGLVILGIELGGLLPAPLMPMSPFAGWITGSMNLVLAAIILYLATTSVNAALKRARRNERALDASNRELRHEIVERERVEKELQRAHDELEVRVQERTVALAQANTGLQLEVLERKRAEELLRSSLQEKEVLLKEIHHRVKNNLQVISSLLSLQSNRIGDERLKTMFFDSQNRVKSMALVHERLYQSPNLAQIEFAEYIRQLGQQLFATYESSLGPVMLQVDAQPNIALAIDEAVPCGLIVNELVSNALKHAFPNQRSGEVRIALYSEDGERIVLQVSDDGVGFPETLDFRNTNSLGMQLVNMLVDQLSGRLELDRQDGTIFRIEFISPSHDTRFVAGTQSP